MLLFLVYTLKTLEFSKPRRILPGRHVLNRLHFILRRAALAQSLIVHRQPLIHLAGAAESSATALPQPPCHQARSPVQPLSAHPALQVVKFNAALRDLSDKPNPRLIDGIVLTKFDTIDDKVGASISGQEGRLRGGGAGGEFERGAFLFVVPCLHSFSTDPCDFQNFPPLKSSRTDAVTIHIEGPLFVSPYRPSHRRSAQRHIRMHLWSPTRLAWFSISKILCAVLAF